MIQLIKNLPWPWRVAALQAENKQLRRECDRLAQRPVFREVCHSQGWMVPELQAALVASKDKVVADLARMLNVPVLQMLQDAMRDWPEMSDDRPLMRAAYEEREDFYQIELCMPRISKTIRVAPRRLPY